MYENKFSNSIFPSIRQIFYEVGLRKPIFENIFQARHRGDTGFGVGWFWGRFLPKPIPVSLKFNLGEIMLKAINDYRSQTA